MSAAAVTSMRAPEASKDKVSPSQAQRRETTIAAQCTTTHTMATGALTAQTAAAMGQPTASRTTAANTAPVHDHAVALKDADDDAPPGNSFNSGSWSASGLVRLPNRARVSSTSNAARPCNTGDRVTRNSTPRTNATAASSTY